MDDVFAWKNPHACSADGCDRTATIGYTTCARCRLRGLVARHPEVLGPVDLGLLAALKEEEALPIERPFRAVLNARDVARNTLARTLGAPTTLRPEGGDVVCTFVPLTEAAHA